MKRLQNSGRYARRKYETRQGGRRIPRTQFHADKEEGEESLTLLEKCLEKQNNSTPPNCYSFTRGKTPDARRCPLQLAKACKRVIGYFPRYRNTLNWKYWYLDDEETRILLDDTLVKVILTVDQAVSEGLENLRISETIIEKDYGIAEDDLRAKALGIICSASYVGSIFANTMSDYFRKKKKRFGEWAQIELPSSLIEDACIIGAEINHIISQYSICLQWNKESVERSLCAREMSEEAREALLALAPQHKKWCNTIEKLKRYSHYPLFEEPTEKDNEKEMGNKIDNLKSHLPTPDQKIEQDIPIDRLILQYIARTQPKNAKKSISLP